MRGGEELVLALLAALPDRPDRMDHHARGEVTRRRRLGVARLAAAQAPRLLEDRRPAGAMDCAVDASAAEER
jgi:hypothetical protein